METINLTVGSQVKAVGVKRGNSSSTASFKVVKVCAQVHTCATFCILNNVRNSVCSAFYPHHPAFTGQVNVVGNGAAGCSALVEERTEDILNIQACCGAACTSGSHHHPS